jgi:uncharacterized protein (TIGR01319 family)
LKAYLLIDFGSTYTKLTAVDLESECILGTSKSYTTVETDIMKGYESALEILENTLEVQGVTKVAFERRLACSSAAGGLKMVAIGLVPELTAEAAKRAALGAGARVLEVLDHDLTRRDMEKINSLKPDMILLAGGTDGGNHACILHNAKKLAEAKLPVPIVVAGNKTAVDDIEDLFQEAELVYRVADNVMPRLNVLNVDPAREEIREIFMQRITHAKGIHAAAGMIDDVLMPTPAAVLKAAELLSRGTDLEDGIGPLAMVDIGGATTDVYSICDGEPSQPGVTQKGLQEPFAKRTVEGDLGMRYSALSLKEAAGTKRIRAYLKDETADVEAACRYRNHHTDMIPLTEEDKHMDEAIAKAAVALSVERHAGYLESYYTPMGVVISQMGKDLSEIQSMIGTGGVLVASDNPVGILKEGLSNPEEPLSLRPKHPVFRLDKDYILSAMGLLAQDHPDIALRIMKRHIVTLNQ